MKKIVIVGAGDYYKSILASSLGLMEKEGLCELFATCGIELKDVNKPDVFSKVEHIARAGSEKLSALLSDFENENTIIILSHANRFHVPDAQDLVKNNFKVMIEKPYCINKPQLAAMEDLIKDYPDKIGLLEYYLTMKSIPLLILAGKVKKNSFYFKKQGLLKAFVGEADGLSGKIKEFIGEPKSILVEVLEGEDDVGRVDHRGAHLSDLREGGGMIQDLGIHALSPLLAIEDYIGKIDESFKDGKVRIARCQEYINMAKKKFKLADKYIGESYAEFEFLTSKSLPVKVAVGKYILDNENQRRIVIIGSQGKAFLDLSSCCLFLSNKEGPETKILEIPKMPDSKYYPVIRAAFETLQGDNPFNFDATHVALKTQSFILSVLEKAYLGKNKIALYKAGASPQNIF